MAILKGDVRLVASAIMDDVPEGGGPPTATVIQDGESNNIFPDISELDRAGGRVNLRKVHVHVQTGDRDTLLGTNFIVAEPPNDPNVSITVFSTNDTFDTRSDAAARIASYLVRGPTWGGFLYENHIAGQRAIQIFQRPNMYLPNVGQTFVLVQDEGLGGEYEQFVRVTRVAAETRTFYDTGSGSDYTAVVVTCDISDALRYDFLGSEATRRFQASDLSARLSDTTVADAGSYAGVVPLTTDADIGNLSVQVSGVFTQLVPSAQTEIPMTDMKPNGEMLMLTASGGAYAFGTAVAFDSLHSISVGQNILPGSLTIAVGGTTLQDSGGRLMAGLSEVGRVDYAQGIISAVGSNSYPGYKDITYTPAAAPSRVMNTASWVITPESRSSTFVTIIDPPPAPTTVQISYRAQNRWYTLQDDGTGRLSGSSSEFGSGTVNYTTGSLVVTLGALPDAYSNVLCIFGSTATEDIRAGGAVALGYDIALANGGVAPNTVTIEWAEGATPRAATDNGTGLLTGDATGTVDYRTGAIRIVPTTLPSANPEFSVEYSWGEPEVETFVAPERELDGSLILALGNPNVMPGSIEVEWNTVYNPDDLGQSGRIYSTDTYTQEVLSTRPWTPPPPPATTPRIDPIVTVRDNATGAFLTRPETDAAINYVAGTIQFTPDVGISLPKPVYEPRLLGTSSYSLGTVERVDVGARVQQTIDNRVTRSTFQMTYGGFQYITIGATFPADLSGYVKVTYRTTAAGTTATEVFTPVANADLTVGFRDPIVQGSLSFTTADRRYFDRQGRLYTDLDLSTGAATLAGTVNYATGKASVTILSEGDANTGTVLSMSTTQALLQVPEIKFRTSVAPIRPGGFVVQFVLSKDATQSTRTLTADINGTINASDVKGEIDYETGVVSLRFGEMVIAAGFENESWYHPDYLSNDGKIWRPYSAMADSIRYAAVAYTYLPLDADVLGLDPVRLPQDGRVPIFRPGGFAVVGHTATTSPATVSAAQTLDVGRTRLSRVRVLGDDGATIFTGYTADLEAGTVTFTDVTGYSQPITIEHRIEDMAQIGDVQISGALGFTRQLTHDFPSPGSYVSSALIAGDLRSRVSLLFDQQTWDGTTWLNAMDGAPATGTYNNTLSPVEVNNMGAVTERWAFRFTSTTAFQIIGEHVGVIGTGTINAATAPINPATGTPYFIVPEEGWGGGWSVGNIVRMNTIGAQFPVWVVRTVQQGPEAGLDYSFSMVTRGGVDRP